MESGKQRSRSWKWRSAEEKREIVERYRQSELSRAAFCKREGISESTFRNWVTKEGKGKKNSNASFIPVSVRAEPEPEWRLELELKSGTVVRVR